MTLIEMAERGLLPDWVIRQGIRRLLRRRQRLESRRGLVAERDALREFSGRLRAAEIALETQSANEQHYEVPAAFFQRVLGPRLKYSCCSFDGAASTLAEAEERMLQATCEHAQLDDGMQVLDLGCGWGALSLWIAERYPRSQILAVSNSNSQRSHLEQRARETGLGNVEVLTADMRQFTTQRRFDRVVSVEMFEHMRNYEALLARIAGWLEPAGRLLVHIFCHRRAAYLFETGGAADWMGRHFFTGGSMPSDDLLLYFQRDLWLEDHWRFDGRQYARTCRCWLENLDQHREELLGILAGARPEAQPRVELQRWRMFLMACEELFRFDGGSEWFVSHYLFRRRP